MQRPLLLTSLPHLVGTLKGIERMTQTIVYYLIALNIVTFFVYGIDKWKAKRAKWRIREAALLGLAVLGGCIGALLGMKVWFAADSASSDCTHICYNPKIEKQ